MTIRRYNDADSAAVWEILEPIIREGEAYALPQDLPEPDVLAFWLNPPNEVCVAEENGQILGTYFIRPNQRGNGSHVANAGYATHPLARGKGVARAMCLHSIEAARTKAFRAMQFNFVVSTNEPAVHLWQSLGFEIVGRLPAAFRSPSKGYVDVFVMYRALE